MVVSSCRFDETSSPFETRVHTSGIQIYIDGCFQKYRYPKMDGL